MEKDIAYIVRQLSEQADGYLRKANIYDPSYPAHKAYADTARRYQQLAGAVAAGLFDQLDKAAADETEQDRQIAEDDARNERTDAEILAELRGVFGEPVEGRDFHVMPARRSHEHCPGCPACTGYADPDEPDNDEDTGYSDEQLDGTACAGCNCEFLDNEPHVPTGIVIDGGQLFAHRDCNEERSA